MSADGGFEAREPDQRHDLTQPVKLDDRLHAAAEARLRFPPDGLRQAPGMEVRIHGYVIAEALGRRQQLAQFGFLHGATLPDAAPHLSDHAQHVGVCERTQLLGDLGLLLHEREMDQVVDDFEVVPQLPYHPLYVGSSIGQ